MMVIEQLSQVFEVIFNFYKTVGDFTYNFFFLYSRPILDVLHFVFDNLFHIIFYLTIILSLIHLAIILIVYFKKAAKELPIKDGDLPTVTVQIPTYNELAAINCARRSLNFDYPKNKVQVIIGDDSSDKDVSRKIDEFAKANPRVTITRRGLNIGFKPGNLNHMLKHTTGDFIVIFDSDFLPEKDFLRRIIAPFVHDPEVHAVQSRWLISNFSQNFSSIVGGIIPLFSHRLALPFLNLVKSNSFIAGSGEAVRKKTLIEMGGWTSGALTEDIEYSFRLTKAGKKIVYLENLGCECESPFSVKDLCKQQMRWAYGVISALKMHFFSIIKNKKIPAVWKINPPLLLSGYLITFNFFLLVILGFFSLITHEPAPIIWSEFFGKVGMNLLLTSGVLLVSIIILNLTKRISLAPKLIVASFSVGLLVVYHVSKGIFKALMSRPMQWFMLTKKGNAVRL